MSSLSKLCTHLCSENDLWVEILTRLPVTTLGFLCVCKSWNSFISSPFFITQQHLSLIRSSCSTIVDVFGKSYFLWSRHMISLSPSYAFYNPRVSIAEYPKFLRSPFRYQMYTRIMHSADLIDVIHGIVCLSLTDTGTTVLWNPTIRKYLEIPPSPFHMHHYRAVGFGFNDASKNYDFKVVCQVWRAEVSTYEVFSTRDGGGCWRKVNASLIVPGELGGSCFSNGAIYWIVRRDSKGLLVLFDCEHDEFRTMELPQQFDQGKKSLCTFRGMLSVVLWTQSGEPERWVMEEYVVVARWRRLYVTGDFVEVMDKGVYQSWPDPNAMVPKESIHSLEEYWGKLPLNAYVFEESMFFMDAESQAKSYTMKEDEDGKINYVKDGKRLPANYYDYYNSY